MAITLTEEFDGTDGVALSAGNTIFGTLHQSGGTAVFDDGVVKSGTAAGHFQTSGNYRFFELIRTSITARFWSVYLYPTAHPAANTPIFFVGATRDAAGRTFQLVYNSNGSMKIQQGAAAVIVGSNTNDPLPLGEWSRVDLGLNNGAVTFALYPGDDNCDKAVGTADGGNTASGSIGTNNATILLGPTSSSTVNLRFDAFREDDTAVPGPIATAPEPVHRPWRLIASGDPVPLIPHVVTA